MSFSNLLASYAAKKMAPPVAVIAKQADYVHPSCIELEKIWYASSLNAENLHPFMRETSQAVINLIV
jgi:hypothetical protein